MARGRTLAALALGFAPACNLFSPNVGTQNSACAVTDGSAPTAASAYGAPTIAATVVTDATAPPASCSDAASNLVAADGAVAGNVIIADQFNNRVIEVTPVGQIVWQFGDGGATPNSTSIVGPNDVERLPNDGGTLITGTGAPPGSEPACQGEAGCPDNRVLLVSSGGAVLWCFGATIDGGAVDGGLSSPSTARFLTADGGAGHVLIVDQGNRRVIEVDVATKAVVWQFPPSADASIVQQLDGPNSAERLPNGSTLITDQAGSRVLLVSPTGNVVWQYNDGLSGPAFASRLAPADGGTTGNTLIADSLNRRVLEVDHDGGLAWSYPIRGEGIPTRAVRLSNGHTLITVTSADQVLEVDNTPENNIVYSHGQLGVAGRTGNLLNQPYDAKRIGDYTGLTAPGL